MIFSTLERQFDQLFYQTQQRFLVFPFGLFRYLITFVLSQGKLQLPPAEIKFMQERFDKLLLRDLDNVAKGYYPRELLYQMPMLEYLPKYPLIFFDLLPTLTRSMKKNYNDLPPTVTEGDYPAYYTRNFHWQTDGYFSNYSASIYDASVELLFLGMADVMRRQIIPPVSQYLQEVKTKPANIQVLDIACGTGRALAQLSTAHPKLQYTGLDLSPYYLKEARKVLRKTTNLSLLHANAEDIPLKDHSFDIVTSVYLFHELPRDVRRTVIGEMYRVLKPGGLLVIEDSCQLVESSGMEVSFSLFPQQYHEPYYKDYIRDDLTLPLAEAGFEDITSEAHYVSKVFVARKPS